MKVTVVILAGGRSQRFGADKLDATVQGRTLFEVAVTSGPPDWPVVAVGPRRATSRVVTWTREDPPGGGPAAALAAGLAVVQTDTIVVVAADQPYAATAIPRLVKALRKGRAEGGGRHHRGSTKAIGAAVGVDPTGMRQSLLAAYDVDTLRSVLDARPASGRSMRSVLEELHIVDVPLTADESHDVDWPDDLPDG